MDTRRADLLGAASECEFHMARPIRVRPHEHHHACAGFHIHLGPTENDHAAVHGPKAVRQPSDDALVDAFDDRVLLVHTA